MIGVVQICLTRVCRCGKIKPAGGGGANQRCTADNHVTDSECSLANGIQCPDLKSERQQGLVDHENLWLRVSQPYGSKVIAVNLHFGGLAVLEISRTFFSERCHAFFLVLCCEK